MIQNSQLMNNLKSQIETANLSESNLKILAAKYRELLIEGLEIGDILEGIITPNGEGKYTLDLKPGIHIPVGLLSQADIGKLIKLVVENKQDGQLILSTFKEEGTTNLSDIASKELELPQDARMKQCLNTFIENQLPLKKEALMQAYYLEKNYQVPAQVVANLLEKFEILPNQLIENIETLKNNGVYPITEEIGQIIKQVESKEDLMKLVVTLSEGATKEQLENILKVLKKEAFNEPTFKAAQMLQDEIPLINKETLLKEVKSSILPKSLESILIDKNFNKVLQELFQKPENLKMFVTKLYDETMVLDLKTLKNGQSIKEESFELYNKLARTINVLEEMPLKETAKEYIGQIRQPIALLGTMNQIGDYFMFPVQQQQVQDAEVYFFRPKKAKKNSDSELYTVVALDLPAIDHIEVHIHQQGKKLSLGFNLKDENVKKFIMIHAPKLQQELENLGYQILQCTYSVTDIKINENHLLKDYTKGNMNHIDFRA